MPTTILDGESLDDARRRRFREESEFDARIAGTATACWRCNTFYDIGCHSCPSCRAANANVDLDLAQRQMEGEQ